MTITGDVWIFVIVIMAIIFTGFSRQNILWAFAASLMWIYLLFRLFFGDNPLIGLEGEWSNILIWAFIMLCFIPWVVRMDVEIKNEARGKEGSSQAYKTWGATPKGKTTTPAEDYRKVIHRRIAGR